MVLKRGLNRAALALPTGIGTLVTLTMHSFYRYRPGGGRSTDLVAVLSELKADEALPSKVAAA